MLKKLDDDLFADDLLSGGDEFAAAEKEAPELVEGWKVFKKAGFDDLALNTKQLKQFSEIAGNNNLNIDAKGLEDLLKAPSAKIDKATGLPLKWDHPDQILDAVQRASDANISGLSISHKKFPTLANGTDNFVLKNAKQYQAEASFDAGLSFVFISATQSTSYKLALAG